MKNSRRDKHDAMTKRDHFILAVYCSSPCEMGSDDVCDVLGMPRGGECRPPEDFLRAKAILAVREADALIAALEGK